MTPKQVIPRRQATFDAEEIIDHYLETSPEAVALGFVGALESAYARIGRHPGIGSLRYSYELELPGLRSWVLKGYPDLVFYIERDGAIDVWRVLHGSRDLPRWTQESTDP